VLGKDEQNQAAERRTPRQERSRQKVELMLEAAVQLLEQSDLASMTTNAVAARAGVSIGSLYQYFGSKQALLDALVARELGAMAEQVIGAMRGTPVGVPGERIRKIVHAVTGAYGGRGRVHRQLMEHALAQGAGRRLSGLQAQVLALFTAEGVKVPGRSTQRLSPAQAFVLTHAMSGVLRALSASPDAPALQEVEDALVRLVLRFLEPGEAT
jgi:AcrR family transcriptional regulator